MSDPRQELEELRRIDELEKKAASGSASANDGGVSAQGLVEGFGQGATMGYLPQLQAAAGALVPNPSAGVDADLEAKGFKISQPDDTYLSRRDESVRRQAQYQKDMPKSYMASQLLGALSSAPIASKALGGIKYLAPVAEEGLGAGLLKSGVGGAIQGAVANPGDTEGEISPLQLGDRLKNAEYGGLIGAGTHLGATAAGKAYDAVSEPLSKTLQKYGRTQAFESTGAMLKDFRKAYSKGTTQELGQEMLDTGLANPGMTYEKIAQKSGKILDKTGEEIGSIYDAVKPAGLYNSQGLAGELAEEALKVRPKVTGTRAFDKAVTEVTDNIANAGDKVNDVRFLHDSMKELDSQIDWAKVNKEAPSVEQGLRKLRSVLRGKVDDLVEDYGKQTGNPQLSDRLKALNKTYGNQSEINRISADRALREAVKGKAGLKDLIVGGAGAVTGATIGSAISGKEGGLGGAAVGAGLGVLNHLGSKYGSPILSRTAVSAGNNIGRVSPTRLTTNPAATGFVGNNVWNTLYNKKEKP